MKDTPQTRRPGGGGACLALTSVSNGEQAQQVATALVEEGLAACVSQVPGRSTYRWQGELCHESEVLLLIKTRTALIPAIEARFARLHPYETPELLAFSVESGSGDYLAWLLAGTRG